MGLVKKGDLSPRRDGPSAMFTEAPLRSPRTNGGDTQRRPGRGIAGRQQKAAERIASATAQLASGITEASSAAEELKRAMEMIAAGAEEAASVSEESQRAVALIAARIRISRENAETAGRKCTALQNLIAGVSAQIGSSVANIGTTAQRQIASVVKVAELERQASNISEIVKAVGRIADQINLLALNAAIEAARAGQHGKGFAVVADEVRTLAETSEKSAHDIEGLIGQIQHDVQDIAEGINGCARAARDEVEKGRAITEQLDRIRRDIGEMVRSAEEIVAVAVESDLAARDVQKGSESIAAAAEEQSGASQETLKTVQQQAVALVQSEKAAAELAEIADHLRNAADGGNNADDIAAAAEELSSAVEEINRSASEVLTALDHIHRGAQQQAAATQQSAAAITQIDQGARLSQERAAFALERGSALAGQIRANRDSVESLIAGVARSVEDNARLRERINGLELVSRRIDKIVDAITVVAIQTNMLAVSGAIEAARAGEFGKGFMVVSTDIRNLARDSAENADRIKDLVKAIQDQILAVRRDLEEVATAAFVEVERNKATSGNLQLMQDDMALILSGSEEIQKSAQEITAALIQARSGSEQLATTATQASQASVQAAQAAREQTQGAEDLAAAVEEIASLADEMLHT